MGDSNTSTIYAAELYGIGLALFLAMNTDLRGKNVVIFTDNQSAIKKLQNPDNKSGQQYVKEIILRIEKLRSMGCTLRIQWVPGHVEIEGNELVDKLAKEAALNPRTGTPPDLALLRTTVKRTLKAKFRTRWNHFWRYGKFGRRLHELIPTPHRKVQEFYEKLPRVISSTVVRIRTGTIPLKGYLGRINRAPTTECLCGGGDETVRHLVLNCPLQTALRTRIWGTQHPWDLRTELSDPSKATKIALFIIKTGALGQAWDAKNIAQTVLTSSV